MSSVYLAEKYYGSSGNYAYDIAIIVLSTKITVSNAVLPVCIDWTEQYSVSNGIFGKVNLFNTIIEYLRCNVFLSKSIT